MLAAYEIHGCLDGVVLKFDGETVFVFRDAFDAYQARRTAIQANAMLAATLANPDRAVRS